MGNTSIEWTGWTWNPVSGCTRVSPGCDRCFIERTPPFRIEHRRFDRPGIGGTTGVQLHEGRLLQPIRMRKPRRIFVCSLADLFHDRVPDLFIAKVWATLARAPQHEFQVLTKRPARMRALLGSHGFELMVEAVCGHHDFSWPLPNVWCGVSVEDQARADLRIPALLATPAAVRWVSMEPLLGRVDLGVWMSPVDFPDCWDKHSPTGECARCIRPDWVVVGGESGPGARPMDLDAAARIVAQCQQVQVPVFVKQLGTMQGGRGHHDIETFPEALRVREYPAEREAVSTP